MSTAARTLCEMLADTLRWVGQMTQAETLLRALAGASEESPSVAEFRSVALPQRVAACYYDDARVLAQTHRANAFAEALGPLTEHLRWTQTDSYVQSPPHERFLERYAHATILGSQPSSAILVDESRTAAVGVLLLGPNNQYPHHQHYADEVYVPLTHARWSSGRREPYVDLPPGSTLHHQSLQPHSVHTDDTSLLTLYLWTGDTTTSAWLC